MNLSKRILVLVCFFLLALFQACMNNRATEITKTLRIQVNNEPDILNPVLSRLSVSTFIESMMNLPLATWDDQNKSWLPVLVQSYEPRKANEGVEYSLILRPEVRWSDGRRVNLTDMLYTLKMGLNPFISHQSWAAYLDLITGLRVAGDSLILSMETPYILADEFIAGLSPFPAHILDSADILDSIPFETFLTGDFSVLEEQKLRTLATSFNAYGKPDQWPEPVTGLFHVSNWVPDQNLTLTRVNSFWGAEVETLNRFYDTNIDTFQYVVIPDPQNALHAYTSGAIDVLNTVNARDSVVLSSFSGEIHEVPTLQLYYIAVNHRNRILEDKKIRKALNMSVNRQDLVRRLFHDMGQPAFGPIHPDKSYYGSLPVLYDPDEARLMLQEAGCRDANNDGILECPVDGKYLEMSFHIWTTRSQISRNVATLIKGYWKAIGVDLKIQSADFRSFLPELQNKSYDFATLALLQNNLLDDPYPLWHSSQADATGKNYQGFANDSVDYVLEQIRQSIFPDDQKRYYRLLQNLFDGLVPVFFLVAPDEIIGVRDIVDLHWSMQRPGYNLLRSKIKQ